MSKESDGLDYQIRLGFIGGMANSDVHGRTHYISVDWNKDKAEPKAAKAKVTERQREL